jgi:hypothetical protein
MTVPDSTVCIRMARLEVSDCLDHSSARGLFEISLRCEWYQFQNCVTSSARCPHDNGARRGSNLIVKRSDEIPIADVREIVHL